MSAVAVGEETTLRLLAGLRPGRALTLDEHLASYGSVQPTDDLIAAVEQRWPEYPPYEGAFDEPIPHLTVSETPIELNPQLPIASRAHEVTLIEQAADGRWAVRRRFPLAT